MAKTFYFPGETKVKARTTYKYVYRVNCKVVKSGTCKGAEMVKMPQYAHHNAQTWHEFEFCIA